LKLLPSSLAGDSDYGERFRRESYLAARLNDPHVMPIHRFGTVAGQLFIDMRLVNGLDLDKLIEQEGPLPAARAISIVAQAAQALEAAHDAKLIHRDVKPSNLLVDSKDFVYLVDFGIARSGLSTDGGQLTATGAAIGTLDYMAPERFVGDRDIDERVDVYSLACVLYGALTAQRPFPVAGLLALMHAHTATPPPKVTALRPDLPAAVNEVVRRGMAKEPAERYAGASELAAAAYRAIHDRAGGGPPASTTKSTVPATAAEQNRPGTRTRGGVCGCWWAPVSRSPPSSSVWCSGKAPWARRIPCEHRIPSPTCPFLRSRPRPARRRSPRLRTHP